MILYLSSSSLYPLGWPTHPVPMPAPQPTDDQLLALADALDQADRDLADDTRLAGPMLDSLIQEVARG